VNTQTDRLSGDYVIYQPVQGQRYSTDDMLVAWLAVRELREGQKAVSSFLDLGCGLCAVPMI
jgi:tRNA1(Val) A37 N6-methylase TrmN6